MQGLFERLKEKWQEFCEKNGLYFSRSQIFALLLLVALLISGIFLHYFSSRPAKLEEIPIGEKAQKETNEPSIKFIVVHVCGAVREPGIYRLPEGSRVYQAIEKAGGELAEADTDSLNLARPLKDGERVYVPYRGENTETGSDKTNGRINLNRASSGDLESLPGIGEELARRIVEYRKKHGPFLSVEEVLNVEGIGKKKFESIKDKICVE